MTITDPIDVHAAWLPPEAFRAIGSRRTLVRGDGILVETVRDEVARACARYGGGVRHLVPGEAGAARDRVHPLERIVVCVGDEQATRRLVNGNALSVLEQHFIPHAIAVKMGGM